MDDCIFCRIIKGDIPAKKVYEDDEVLAFHDINPQAPTHVLVIPKKHIPFVAELDESDAPLMGKVILAGKKIARELKLHREGFRMVINNGRFAGQQVFHIHLHLLGGRPMNWPPG